jgi:HSP20 family protein
MALIRWEPFHEMETLRRQMDQLFDDLTRANRQPSALSQEVHTAWVPAIEMKDSDSDIVLRAEIPGVEGKDLDIQVTREAVSISGEHRYEKRTEERGRFRSEFRYGKFQRVVPLPAQVQNDQVKADFKDGILTLTLPKVEAERHRVVRISIGETQPASAKLEAGNGHNGSSEAQNVEVKSAGTSD